MTSALDNLDFLQTKTVADLVRQEILRMIKAGEILAGSRLNELGLSQLLRVSRAPIREAFRALEEAGLVKLEKNRGVFVREISAEEARELYDLRATLDAMTGKRLAKHITSGQLDELFTWLDRLETAAAGDVGVYFPLNIAFHDRIVEMTGNTVLLEFYRRVIDRMHLLRRRSLAVPDGNNPSRLEHRRIVEALQSQDPERAGNALRAHVENGFQRFLDISGTSL
jgi:DNA-binding GntR family transcriptional regulator